MNKKHVVEDILNIKDFICTHKDMIFARIQYAGKTVMETQRLDSEKKRGNKSNEYQVLFFAGCLPFINSVIQVGSNPRSIRSAINAIENGYSKRHKFVDSVAILSKNALYYIIEYCIALNDEEMSRYDNSDEKGKTNFWEQVIKEERTIVEGGEIEANMLTLGHSEKESYWDERKQIWKMINDYIAKTKIEE
ncbi:MAG: hypothetical protein WAW37_03200 [Syntrophobacteraceae bacterium]